MTHDESCLNFAQVIAEAPGPTPWYPRQGNSGLAARHGPLRWEERASKMLLVTRRNEVLAILDYYCYIQTVAGTRFLVWFAERTTHPGVPCLTVHITVKLLDADQMAPIEDVPGASSQLNWREGPYRVSHVGGEVSSFQIPCTL